jgi:hypothetical protein
MERAQAKESDCCHQQQVLDCIAMQRKRYGQILPLVLISA